MKQTKNQAQGTAGEQLILYLLSKCQWVGRAQEKDYGIDIEAELVESEKVTGYLLKIQVKTTRKAKGNDNYLTISVTRNFLLYAESCRLPVILVGVDIQSEKAYYLWIQKWMIDENITRQSLNTCSNSIKIKVPKTFDFQADLNGFLRKIAKGETGTSIALNLKEAVKLAVNNNSKDLAILLMKTMARYKIDHHDMPLHIVISEVLKMKPNDWNRTGSISFILYDMCAQYGSQFTCEDVISLVLRDGGESRTGVNALGILYREHFEHISSMNLQDKFIDYPVSRYFCWLQEKFPGGLLKIPVEKGIPEKYGLSFDKDYFFDKYFNRGESAFLDAVYQTEEVSEIEE